MSFTSLLAHNGCLGLFKGQGDFDTKHRGAGVVANRVPLRRLRLAAGAGAGVDLAPAEVPDLRTDVELEGSIQAYAALAEEDTLVEARVPRRRTEKKIHTASSTIPLELLQKAFPFVDSKFACRVWESRQGHRSTVFVLAAVVDNFGRLPPSIGRAPDLSPADWPVVGGRKELGHGHGRGRLVSGDSEAGSDWDIVSAGDDAAESEGWEVIKAESSQDGDHAAAEGGAVALPQPKVSYACIVLSFIPTDEVAAASEVAAPPRRHAAPRRKKQEAQQQDLFAEACEAAESYDAVELQAHNKYGVARLRGFEMSKMRPQQAARRAKRIAAKGPRAAG